MKSIGIVANPRRPLATSVVPELVGWLEKRGVKVRVEEEAGVVVGREDVLCPGDELRSSCELIIALGGDGTLLKAARLVGATETPILGVNMGSLGFLTEVVLEELYPTLELVLGGEGLETEPRMTLEARVEPSKKVFHALNDIVVSMGKSGRMVGFTTWVGKEWVSTYTADGVIVATPTGSTAYSLAASGPIVTPTMEAIVISPICPHTLGLRPMVISAEKVFTIEVGFAKGGDALLICDGQERTPLENRDRISLRKGDHYVRLVKSPGRSFYEILRKKLNWGGREEVR